MHSSLQDGLTALMRASVTGQVECVKLLLDMGAGVNMQNKVSGVIIHFALTHSLLLILEPNILPSHQLHCVDVLLVHGKVWVQNTILHWSGEEAQHTNWALSV